MVKTAKWHKLHKANVDEPAAYFTTDKSNYIKKRN